MVYYRAIKCLENHTHENFCAFQNRKQLLKCQTCVYTNNSSYIYNIEYSLYTLVFRGTMEYFMDFTFFLIAQNITYYNMYLKRSWLWEIIIEKQYQMSRVKLKRKNTYSSFIIRLKIYNTSMYQINVRFSWSKMCEMDKN